MEHPFMERDDDYANSIETSSLRDHDTTANNGVTSGTGDRDEVKEVMKLSAKETSRVKTWRIVVALIMVMTGAAVTGTSYFFLRREEEKNFDEAVSTQFC